MGSSSESFACPLGPCLLQFFHEGEVLVDLDVVEWDYKSPDGKVLFQVRVVKVQCTLLNLRGRLCCGCFLAFSYYEST